MYIVQIADLHVGSDNKSAIPEKNLMQLVIERIKTAVPQGEQIQLCCCGDIIDSSAPEGKKLTSKQIKKRYDEAYELFVLLTELSYVNNYQVSLKFCVGNHDITHINEFKELAKKFGSEDDFTECYAFEQDGAVFVYVNSCYGNKYKNGIVNYENLEKVLNKYPKEKEKILILHHTIMSMDDNDTASIRNAARLLDIINRYNIIASLHGHIHGRNVLTIGKNHCKLIGTGALFSRNNPDINSQFNIIHLKNGIIKSVENNRYMADGRNAGSDWNIMDIGEFDCENSFHGHSFEKVRQDLYKILSVQTPLYNVSLQISCSYEELKEELSSLNKRECLRLGMRKYTYRELAELWENIKCPEELYFNHGEFFKVKYEHGINLVAKQLKERPTSNRAIMATYDMEKISNNIQGNQNLPSLESIQFSKDNDNTLYVHMHLRALEASRFLNINVNEILYLLEKLKSKNVEFNNVNVTISAFRVQIRDKFACFLKAGIDSIEPVELGMKMEAGCWSEICALLEEKRDASETITHSEGIKELWKAVKYSNKDSQSKGIQPIFSEHLSEILNEILKNYNKLDTIQQNKSIQGDEERKIEKAITKQLNEVIDELQKISNQNERKVE